MANSVEVGPGMRLAAPSKSRNSCSLTHWRRFTTSACMMAMCAAGPPKAVNPRRRNSTATSVNRWREGGVDVSFPIFLQESYLYSFNQRI